MYSRKDYLNDICTHREYYGQLVEKLGINTTSFNMGRITSEDVINSIDKYFNDIPLAKWDEIAELLPIRCTLSEKVCILKEAALRYKEYEYIKSKTEGK